MASPEIETVGSGSDKLKLAASVFLLVAAFAAYYMLSKQGLMAQWGALIVLVAGSVGMFFISDSGRRLLAFGRDSAREVKKVVWPERKEAIQMTMYVFGFVLVMSFFLWVTDKTIEWLFYDLILGWRK